MCTPFWNFLNLRRKYYNATFFQDVVYFHLKVENIEHSEDLELFLFPLQFAFEMLSSFYLGQQEFLSNQFVYIIV